MTLWARMNVICPLSLLFLKSHLFLSTCILSIIFLCSNTVQILFLITCIILNYTYQCPYLTHLFSRITEVFLIYFVSMGLYLSVGGIQCPGLISGLRIWHCHELWCRSQIWLGSRTAVAVVWAGSCSSNSTPSWELPYAAAEALKRKKKKNS